ncbi:hypothetical protein Hypma_001704 [Hypsizygus marmoreus]|uniref:MYND-type domain-containing protein n=1 Tax=Hypsizygus marmoreus TaxID=39966 RepID=A0A369J5E0_HYPMA|nr:hypothetical protein Hypma_001704 [Hypsizygus marmoreus]
MVFYPLAMVSDPNSSVPLRSLPRSIQLLVTKAANGSIPEFWKLLPRIRTNNALANCSSVVDMINGHLAVPSPLPCITSEEKHLVEVANVALCALSELTLRYAPNLRRDNSMFASKVFSSWPSIWRWMAYLYYKTDGGMDTAFDAQTRPLTKIRLQIMRSIERIICHFLIGSDPATWKSMKSKPGMLIMLVEIWMRLQEQLAVDDLETFANDFSQLTMALAHFIRMDDIPTIRTLLNGILSNRSKVFLVLSNAIQVAAHSKGNVHAMLSYPLLASIHAALAVHAHLYEVYDIHPSVDVMEDACHVLHTYSSPPMAAFESSRSQCTCAALLFLRGNSKFTNGFAWIIQAIRSKLIQSLLMCACWPIANVSDPTGEILEILTPYLVHRSVLRAVGQTLRSSEVTALVAKLPQGGKFRSKWLTFSRTVETLLQVKNAFDKAGKYTKKCDAPGCNAVETGNEIFRLCGGCQFIYYCSKECQQHDWKEHRSRCEEYRKCRAAGMTTPILTRDCAWLAFLLNDVMNAQREDIIKFRDQAVPMLTPTTTLQLHLDLTSSPSKLKATVEQRQDSAFMEQIANLGIRNEKLPYPPGKLPLFETVVEVPFGRIPIVFPLHSVRTGDLFGWIGLTVIDDGQIKFGESSQVVDDKETKRNISFDDTHIAVVSVPGVPNVNVFVGRSQGRGQ